MSEQSESFLLKIDGYLILILFVGLCACLYRLGMVDMDVDESYTALIVQGPVNKILSQIKETTNAPFYFYVLWAWSKIAGYSPIALRMLSVLFGLATVLSTYIVTKILISTRVARWSALVMVLSPLWLFRARDARMYSLDLAQNNS